MPIFSYKKKDKQLAATVSFYNQRYYREYLQQRDEFYKALIAISTQNSPISTTKLLQLGVEFEGILTDKIKAENGEKFICSHHCLLKAATNFITHVLATKSISTIDELQNNIKVITASKKAFISASNDVCAMFPSDLACKLSGAVLSLIGDLIALLSVGQITCIATKGHRLFSGYRSKINNMQNALIRLEMAETNYTIKSPLH